MNYIIPIFLMSAIMGMYIINDMNTNVIDKVITLSRKHMCFDVTTMVIITVGVSLIIIGMRWGHTLTLTRAAHIVQSSVVIVQIMYTSYLAVLIGVALLTIVIPPTGLKLLQGKGGRTIKVKKLITNFIGYNVIITILVVIISVLFKT